MELKLTIEEEQIILPLLIKVFMKTNPLKTIHAERIIKGMEYIRVANGYFKTKFTEIKLRKLVNWIRSNGILPLIADASGYYIDDSSIEKQIQSLQSRQKGLQNAIDGLLKYQESRKIITNNDPFGFEW